MVSLSSGGFVTVQPPGGRGVHRGRLDGHARPGPRAADGATWDVETEYGGGVDDHHRSGVGGHARLPGRVRRGARARRAAAVARGGGAGRRRGPRRVPAEPGVALLPRLRARGRLRLGPGQPRGGPRRRRRDHHGSRRGAGPRRVAGADRYRRPGDDAHRRAGPPDRRGRALPRRAARAGGPGGVPTRRPPVPHHPGRRLDPGHDSPALGRAASSWPRCCGCSTGGRPGSGATRTSSTWCGCSAQCSATGSTCWTTPPTSSGTRAAFLDAVDADHLAVLESGSTAHVSATDGDGAACSVTVSSGYGSGMIAAGTGIWLNNCLGEQELNPAGLHALPRRAPGCCPTWRRPSAATTTARRWRSAPPAPTGSPPRSCRCWPASSAGSALARGREPPRVHVHRPGRPDEVVTPGDGLTMYFGGVGAALRNADGHLVAAADPRREGAVRLVHPARP